MTDHLIPSNQFSMAKVTKITVNATIGSFIFGYNIGIFNSMQSNVSASLNWGDAKDLYVSIIATLMPLGALFGAIYGGPIATRIGRRRAIIFTDITVVIGSLVFLAPYTWSLAIGRVITGYAAGSFSVLCPVYVSESAPNKVRGKLGSLIQIMITLGIVCAFAIALPLPTEDYVNDPINY